MSNNTVLKVLVIVYVVLSAAALVFFVSRSMNEYFGDTTDATTEACADEINRVKYFIADWNAELKSTTGTSATVFLNELQFSGATYTLTVANGRIRAVYPRGERYFQMVYVQNVEFFVVDSKLRCKLYCGDYGDVIYLLN